MAEPRPEPAVRTLDRAAVRGFYDRFGVRQDSQAFYEDAALDDLVAHADFGAARRVYELGCGTGRFARRLLRHELRAEAAYLAVDLSTTMVALARRRLAPFAPRAEVRVRGGAATVEAADASLDRVVAVYVLDLLAEPEIRGFLRDAARALVPGGRICLVSLTYGHGLPSRLVIAIWSLLFRLAPGLVGGCRPIELLQFLSPADWNVLHHRVVVAWGIPSEVVVAEPRPRAAASGGRA